MSVRISYPTEHLALSPAAFAQTLISVVFVSLLASPAAAQESSAPRAAAPTVAASPAA